MKSTLTDLDTYYLKNGSARFRVVVRHQGLHKVQEIKGEDPSVVWQKAQGKAAAFDKQWAKQVATQKAKTEREAAARDKAQKKELAAELSAAAASDWAALESVLASTLAVDDAVDWNGLKDRSTFSEGRPRPPAKAADLPALTIPREPLEDDGDFVDQPGFFTQILDLFMPARRDARRESLRELYRAMHSSWSDERDKILASRKAAEEWADQEAARVQRNYESVVNEWDQRRLDFLANQQAVNAAIDEDRAKHEQKVPSAVEDYCDLVLQNSEYPDFMPNSWNLQFIAESGIVIVDYDLPNIDALPRLKDVKYVQSRDEFTEKEHSEAALKKAYDALLYQIALRTIHELFESDRHVRALSGAVFNGIVTRIDPATGLEVTSCIMSLQVTREEFEPINLAAVDPKACFKSLKGVGSAALHSVTPVRPLMRLEVDDDRFVDSYAVASTLDDGENLASMDWEDFEHLVREVFELEFGANGAEVKVTRASRDGGIDAVAFDPDPIRGGKIVIQAKRYTRTVGLAAVRDLFGAVLNEGANKGILVTTATYGPDAYSFVRDKPLTLLSGGELLHLLQRHGFKARIDLKEAREAR